MRCAEGNTNRYKDQEEIDRVARQCLPRGISKACWPANPSSVTGVQRLALGVLKGTSQERRMLVDVVVDSVGKGLATIFSYIADL